MSHSMQLAGISGSLRKGSFETALVHAVPGILLSKQADATGRFSPVTVFRKKLAKVVAVLIVSPELNYSISGGLKNAIDWTSRGEDSPLLGKPVAIMGATQELWRTVKMDLAFHPVFQLLNMKPLYRPGILISKA